MISKPLQLGAWLAVASVLSAPGMGQTECTEDAYDVVDRVEGPYIDLGVVPIKPITRGRRVVNGATESALFVLNTHDSTLEIFSESPAGGPDQIVPLPWAPVAIVFWEVDENEPATDELLISFSGTYALMRMKANVVNSNTEWEVSKLIQFKERGPGPESLFAEPSDILLDAAGQRAFVSCPGSDAVVEVSLQTNKIVRVFREDLYPGFRVKAPTFMTFDGQGNILVAPLHSGNNSTAEAGGFIDAGARVLDLAPLPGGAGGLPDEDLFRIDPDADNGFGSVTAVGYAIGTTLFGLGRNGSSGEVWVLNTDADNKDPNRQTEPAIRGDFIANRVCLATPDSDRATFYNSLTEVDFEQDLGVAVGQPGALTFATQGSHAGDGYIVGLLTDNLVRLDEFGNLTGSWNLRHPSEVRKPRLPRGVALGQDEEYAFVYLWGTNELAKVHVNPAQLPADAVQYFSLRHDPTPSKVQAGRRHFYNGLNSNPGPVACASCHINGRSDLLMWNLSAGPQDDKGPMLTQSLVGLEKLGPFHWRGERSLADFNPAFAGLLGGEELGPVAFSNFEAFLFSLQNPANPNQNQYRVIDNSIRARGVEGESSATCGQVAFNRPDLFRGLMSCNECHFLPTGTVGDTFPDSDSLRPRRSWRKVAPFHELWRRDMPDESDIVLRDGSVLPGPLPYLGASMSHSGLVHSLLTFVGGVNGIDNDAGEDDDIASFLHQIDQGIAPAAHRTYWLNQNNVFVEGSGYGGGAYSNLESYLLGQAQLDPPNCGIGVYGEVQVPQGAGGPILADVRWSYDRWTELFVPDTPDLTPQPLSFFADQAIQHGAWNVFVGMPPGMSDRWAIDYDMDGLVNQADAEPYVAATTSPAAPTFVVDPHVVWVSGNVARVAWQTDQPTRYEVDVIGSFGAPWTISSDEFATARSMLVTGLRPSSPVDPESPTIQGECSSSGVCQDYSLAIRAYNRGSGMVSAPQPLTLRTEPLLRDKGFKEGQERGQTIVVDEMDWVVATPLAGDRVDFQGRVHVRYKFDVPSGTHDVQPRVVVASLVRVNTNDPSLTQVLGHADVTLKGSTRMFDRVETLETGGNPNPWPPPTGGSGDAVGLVGSSGGPFLVTHTTAAGSTPLPWGTCDFEFEADVASDESLLLVVENVIPIRSDGIDCFNEVLVGNTTGCEYVNGTGTAKITIPTLPVREPTDMQRWSFPDSEISALEWPEPQ